MSPRSATDRLIKIVLFSFVILIRCGVISKLSLPEGFLFGQLKHISVKPIVARSTSWGLRTARTSKRATLTPRRMYIINTLLRGAWRYYTPMNIIVARFPDVLKCSKFHEVRNQAPITLFLQYVAAKITSDNGDLWTSPHPPNQQLIFKPLRGKTAQSSLCKYKT